MIKFDDSFLEEVGLEALAAEDKKAFVAYVVDELEKRVGVKLVKQMSKDQMTEFEQFLNNRDQQGARSWLESNLPNYKQVVHDELDNLKHEIKTNASQIIDASTSDQSE